MPEPTLHRTLSPEQDGIFIGAGETPQYLPLKYANRHGLIAGATGTGKTVTLQILAEGFSKAGVPVFMADVKGDLSGMTTPAVLNERLTERAETIGLTDYDPEAFPVVFWDLYGEKGAPIRATVSEMGPLLIARLLGLNETQEGVLTLAFRLADDEGLLLLDLKDLRALLVHVGERAKELSLEYGHVSKASIGAIQRRLLALEEQDADAFFGEPALDLQDLLQKERSGAGLVNILAAERLMQSPKLYATFLLWLLSELFEEMPEVGDADRPKLVFFFDEAHLLFDDAPKALLEKVEQVVRLIRSKGVAIFFVTQNPLDVPDSVSSQLATRIIHGLRAFTPREKKVVKAAAETFRPNPAFDAETVIGELGVGEALVSTLLTEGKTKGAPSIVERTLIRPPASYLGPSTDERRYEVLKTAPEMRRYGDAIDRESAYEVLKNRAAARADEAEKNDQRAGRRSAAKKTGGRRSGRQSVGEAAMKSAARTISSTLARELLRGLLGGLRRR